MQAELDEAVLSRGAPLLVLRSLELLGEVDFVEAAHAAEHYGSQTYANASVRL